MYDNKFTVLDGNAEEEKESVDAFLSALTEEEKKEAMSEKYSYLDDID